ncbi:MAG: hypothetical protein QOH61_241 [Chloroflexota bacterium]|jgi:hypothetical protein|nr:hypothetical protein [Chloroflexota bacterium]
MPRSRTPDSSHDASASSSAESLSAPEGDVVPAGSEDAAEEGFEHAADEEAREGPSALAVLADRAESAAESVAQAVSQPIASLVRGAEQLAAGAARRFDDRPGARARRLDRDARHPLPVLWHEHPEALNAPRRDLGLLTVPIDQVRGTAVEGAQRGGDFRPIKDLRGANWQDRWRRVKSAMNTMVALPPVDLLKTGDEYWVVDGHNRVAAAKYLGQDALDASVVELPLPGAPRSELAPDGVGRYLADSMREVRAAGEGRLSRTAGPASDLASTEVLRRAYQEEGAE